MALRLFDSMQRELRELRKPDPAKPTDLFTFYNCGPTVYAPAHIGNFRTFLINDVLRRMLELEYGPEKTRHVRNLTDVDDRTIGQARREGRPLGEITRKWTEVFHRDCAALNCLRPHFEPTATGHIPEQVNMIEVLMEKGNAYRAADGSVYFKVSSFADYGRLSRIKERELRVTNTTSDADHKDDLSDFALWKAHKPSEDGEVQWPGPKGAAAGRPGWHIECSAMSKKLLGDTIDLHTGGIDLLFPHHENEIAQSRCCNGAALARHWYHSEHLLVNGTTMSKSKGNFYTLTDLTDKGFAPMAVRYALLAGHPRKQLNFTLDSVHAAESALRKLRALADRTIAAAGRTVADFYNVSEILLHRASPDLESCGFASLQDDLNTPGALGELFSERDALRGSTPINQFRSLARTVYALGFDLHPVAAPAVEIPDKIQQLANQRWTAKIARDFKAADALRAEIAAAGWTMLDRKDGYSLEPGK